MRDSAALRVVESLLSRGVKTIRAYDPLAAGRSAPQLVQPGQKPPVRAHQLPRHGPGGDGGSDALYISTDWEEFRGLARTIETTVEPPYLVMDGRRMIPDYQTRFTKQPSTTASPSCSKKCTMPPSPASWSGTASAAGTKNRALPAFRIGWST
jgi:hypothetical protein